MDDFFLVVLIKVGEVVAVAGDTDEEVTVFLWCLLRFAQGAGIDDVELDVVALKFKVGPYISCPSFSRSCSVARTSGRNRWLSSVPPDCS